MKTSVEGNDVVRVLFSERFSAALRRHDPLAGDILMRWLDPWAQRDGAIAWGRAAILVLFVGLPPVVLAVTLDPGLGGGFWGTRGLVRDLNYLVSWAFVFPLLVVMHVLCRRAIGDMLNLLEERLGVAVEPTMAPTGLQPPRLLRLLDVLTRLGPRRIGVWSLIFATMAWLGYRGTMADGFQTWLSSPARQGSILYPLHRGDEQPNLSGMYFHFVSIPMLWYILLVGARLIVEFALVCRAVACQVGSRIMPAHPDRTGGLQPIGRTALMVSVSIFAVGVISAASNAQESLVWGKEPVWVIYLGWALYLALGPLFFFLPLLPLRRAMYRAKSNYLVKLHALYRSYDLASKDRIRAGEVKACDLEELFSLVQLIEYAERMSVWPYDRATLNRFVGMVLTPLAPLVIERIPGILQALLKMVRAG